MKGGYDTEDVKLEEETAGTEDWYARASFYRRHRRTNAWSKFNVKKFLELNHLVKMPYHKTEDIVKQYEMLMASRRRLHQLARRAFETVVETTQMLEYVVVANHFRGLRRRPRRASGDEEEVEVVAGTRAYLPNHVWFFVSRLMDLLKEGPRSTEVAKVEAEIRELLKEINDGVAALRVHYE